MTGMERLKAFNQLMQACAKLPEGPQRQFLQPELQTMRAVLKDAAPDPWEVAGQLSRICQAEGEAWCITPKGFVLGEGLLMEAKPDCITLDGGRLTIDAFREAVAALQDDLTRWIDLCCDTAVVNPTHFLPLPPSPIGG